MRYAIVIFLLLVCSLFACSTAFSQNWHSASDTLKGPQNNTGYYVTVAYFNRYDTVPCTYTIAGSKQHRKGFKVVYVLDGYYTDKPETMRVFYDRRMNRIDNVDSYCLK